MLSSLQKTFGGGGKVKVDHLEHIKTLGSGSLVAHLKKLAEQLEAEDEEYKNASALGGSGGGGSTKSIQSSASSVVQVSSVSVSPDDLALIMVSANILLRARINFSMYYVYDSYIMYIICMYLQLKENLPTHHGLFKQWWHLYPPAHIQ